MKTAAEFINEINAGQIATPHHVDEYVSDLDNATRVAEVDYDEHRWYTIATVVYEIGGEFVGVRGPVSLKSESSDWDDIGAVCEAFLMEQVPSVTYRRKQSGSAT